MNFLLFGFSNISLTSGDNTRLGLHFSITNTRSSGNLAINGGIKSRLGHSLNIKKATDSILPITSGTSLRQFLKLRFSMFFNS